MSDFGGGLLFGLVLAALTACGVWQIVSGPAIAVVFGAISATCFALVALILLAAHSDACPPEATASTESEPGRSDGSLSLLAACERCGSFACQCTAGAAFWRHLTLHQFEINCLGSVSIEIPGLRPAFSRLSELCSCFEAGRDPMCPHHGYTAGRIDGE